ncbi:MAG: hypothetical protein HYZ57_05300 [Acidobacteria bacterium]|nr:hypothetical protein [Acidobacteriota bacterium]
MTVLKRIRVWRHAPLMIACCILQAQLVASIIFESASPAASKYPAIAVANNAFAQQAPGVRFHITQSTEIESIGVWIYHNNFTTPGLFGEIFALPDSISFPSTDPYSSSGLARAYFGEYNSEEPADWVAPLSVTLRQGTMLLSSVRRRSANGESLMELIRRESFLPTSSSTREGFQFPSSSQLAPRARRDAIFH